MSTSKPRVGVSPRDAAGVAEDRRSGGWLLSGAVAFASIVAPSASAQDEIRSWDVSSSQASGLPFAAAGDVDGDGVGDVIVETSPDGTTCTVTVYSGATGAKFYEFPGFSIFPPGVNSVGDSNHDGRDDFVVVNRIYATVTIFSGADGSVLHQFAEPSLPLFGYQVAPVGDVDGDDVPDIGAIYWASSTNQGAAVVSGVDGSILFKQVVIDVGSCCASGDLDGDGAAELWIGNITDNAHAGSVTAYSMTSGQAVLTLDGESPADQFGVACVNAGDVDADGIADVAIGANCFNSNAGRVYVYSGATGSLIGTIDGPQSGNYVGSWLARGTDLDGDGHADVFIGNPQYLNGTSNVGRIEVYSGATLALLSSIEGDKSNSSLGSMLANLGDVDGDGYADVVTSDNQVREVVAISMARHPRIASASPNRGRYTGGNAVTLSGKYFAAADTPTVTINGALATNVAVVDDATLTCTLPAGSPGPATITASSSLGVGSLADALTFTPAVTWDGSATPGGSVAIHYLCDPLDGMLAIVGTDPASVPTPPFDGALGIVPFQIVFVLPTKSWPFDHFDLTGNIPNDPSLVGVTVLLQALDGPSFAKPKDATWTNVAAITIQ